MKSQTHRHVALICIGFLISYTVASSTMEPMKITAEDSTEITTHPAAPLSMGSSQVMAEGTSLGPEVATKTVPAAETTSGVKPEITSALQNNPTNVVETTTAAPKNPVVTGETTTASGGKTGASEATTTVSKNENTATTTTKAPYTGTETTTTPTTSKNENTATTTTEAPYTGTETTTTPTSTLRTTTSSGTVLATLGFFTSLFISVFIRFLHL